MLTFFQNKWLNCLKYWDRSILFCYPQIQISLASLAVPLLNVNALKRGDNFLLLYRNIECLTVTIKECYCLVQARFLLLLTQSTFICYTLLYRLSENIKRFPGWLTLLILVFTSLDRRIKVDWLLIGDVALAAAGKRLAVSLDHFLLIAQFRIALLTRRAIALLFLRFLLLYGQEGRALDVIGNDQVEKSVPQLGLFVLLVNLDGVNTSQLALRQVLQALDHFSFVHFLQLYQAGCELKIQIASELLSEMDAPQPCL